MKKRDALVRLPVRQNTKAWLDYRRTGVAASMLPIITRSRPGLMRLWSEHVGLLEPEPPDEAEQELYDLGHLLEPAIAAIYTRKTGRPVKRVDHMIRHPEIEWAYASLDRVSAVAGERRIVELKYAPYRWGDEVDEVPAAVQDQVQWQLFVTGWDVADVVVLLFGRPHIFPIEADPVYQTNLFVHAEWFRRLVLTREQPPVDDSEETRRTLTRLYPRDNEVMLEPTPELSALALALRAAKAQHKSAEAELERIKNALRQALGESSGVKSDALGYRVTWRRTKDKKYDLTDWKSVAAAYRILLEHRDPEQLDALVSIHTNTITEEGYRMLKSYFKDDDSGHWI